MTFPTDFSKLTTNLHQIRGATQENLRQIRGKERIGGEGCIPRGVLAAERGERSPPCSASCSCRGQGERRGRGRGHRRRGCRSCHGQGERPLLVASAAVPAPPPPPSVAHTPASPPCPYLASAPCWLPPLPAPPPPPPLLVASAARPWARSPAARSWARRAAPTGCFSRQPRPPAVACPPPTGPALVRCLFPPPPAATWSEDLEKH